MYFPLLAVDVSRNLLAFVVCAVVALGVVAVQRWRAKEHTFLLSVSEVLARLGFILIPKLFKCLALGDLRGAVEAAKEIDKLIHSPKALEDELTTVAQGFLKQQFENADKAAKWQAFFATLKAPTAAPTASNATAAV